MVHLQQAGALVVVRVVLVNGDSNSFFRVQKVFASCYRRTYLEKMISRIASDSRSLYWGAFCFCCSRLRMHLSTLCVFFIPLDWSISLGPGPVERLSRHLRWLLGVQQHYSPHSRDSGRCHLPATRTCGERRAKAIWRQQGNGRILDRVFVECSWNNEPHVLGHCRCWCFGGGASVSAKVDNITMRASNFSLVRPVSANLQLN